MSEEDRKKLRELLIHVPEIVEWLGDDVRDADETSNDERAGNEI